MSDEFKVGDIVVMRTDCMPYYDTGARCKIVDIAKNGDITGSFKNMGNPDGSFDVACNAEWVIADIHDADERLELEVKP